MKKNSLPKRLDPESTQIDSLQKMAVLTGLKSVRMSASVALADIKSFEGEKKDLFFFIDEAAVAFAHLCAPGNFALSNKLLEDSGFGDLTEEETLI